MEIELLSITPDSEKLIERAGRTCYDTTDKTTDESAADFIKMLIGRGHESVLEHAVATFKITGVSRSLTHQLVRHRLASYSQRSQRYVSEEKGFRFVIPTSIWEKGKENDKIAKAYQQVMEHAFAVYLLLLEEGILKEDARFVLPNACHTEIVMTANFREWRHILKLRTKKNAQWEIREMANIILDILMERAPSVFSDLREE